MQQRQLPKRLNPDLMIETPQAGQPPKVEFRTPSAQFWNSLSAQDQKLIADVMASYGADIEDKLRHMREMLPQNPRGAKT